jgi:hypothetical protein
VTRAQADFSFEWIAIGLSFRELKALLRPRAREVAGFCLLTIQAGALGTALSGTRSALSVCGYGIFENPLSNFAIKAASASGCSFVVR